MQWKYLFQRTCLRFLIAVVAFDPQYSQKEDKYEEEIKVLTDKLKEVQFHNAPSGVLDSHQDNLHKFPHQVLDWLLNLSL